MQFAATNCNNVFWKLHRLCKGLWRQVWRADRQTRQVCPWLGPPGEGAAARVPERYLSSQPRAVPAACPHFDLLLPVWALPWCLGAQPHRSWHGAPFLCQVLLLLGGCRAALAQLTPSPQSPGSGLNFTFMGLQVCWIIFLFQLSCANHRLGIPLYFSTNKFSLLNSVVYIPVSMQEESKIKCWSFLWPVGYLFLWNTWFPVKIQLPVKCSYCSSALCLSLRLT